LLCRIGHIIALIQANVDQGRIIDHASESLLMYDFQPVYHYGHWEVHNGEVKMYLSLDMMIKPLEHIDDTQILEGHPLQLVIDTVTGEVMNNTKAMVQLGLLPDDGDGVGNPESYGFFQDYNAICCFAVIVADISTIKPDELFKGKMDSIDLILNCKAFDSTYEARQFLQESHGLHDGWLVELIVPKEELALVHDHGISKYTIKMFTNTQIEVNPSKALQRTDAKIETEVSNLILAMHEPAATCEEKLTHPCDEVWASCC